MKFTFIIAMLFMSSICLRAQNLIVTCNGVSGEEYVNKYGGLDYENPTPFKDTAKIVFAFTDFGVLYIPLNAAEHNMLFSTMTILGDDDVYVTRPNNLEIEVTNSLTTIKLNRNANDNGTVTVSNEEFEMIFTIESIFNYKTEEE